MSLCVPSAWHGTCHTAGAQEAQGEGEALEEALSGSAGEVGFEPRLGSHRWYSWSRFCPRLPVPTSQTTMRLRLTLRWPF